MKSFLRYAVRNIALRFLYALLFSAIGIGTIFGTLFIFWNKEIVQRVPQLNIPKVSVDGTSIGNTIIAILFFIFQCVVFALICILIYVTFKFLMRLYEKKNYRYYQIGLNVKSYQRKESDYYNAVVRFLKDIHGAKRPVYLTWIFGKMYFSLYVMQKEKKLYFYYAVHKNRAHLLKTFFPLHFPQSELYEVEHFEIPKYKYNRKVFSHTHGTFNTDSHEMMTTLYHIMESNTALCIQITNETKYGLNRKIKKESKQRNKKRESKEVDGLAKNELRERTARLQADDVAFNVNISAASKERSYVNFIEQIKTVSTAHNFLQVRRWPYYSQLVQKTPSLYSSDTFMTDKELAVLFRMPCTGEGE